ncbi:MAG: hypothetical protein ACHQK9_01035 [Reyranellales bacterium]
MQEDHVPSIGARSWTILLVASICGANVGDILTQFLVMGFVGRMLLLAAVLTLIFTGERYDRSKTHAWYWMAVVIIQAASTKLGDFLTIDLGFGRGAVIASLAALLVITFVVVRSSTAFFISEHMIARPGAAAKPMADAAHWMAMVVASTLGSVASDFCTLGLGLGAVRGSLLLTGLLVGIFWLQRLRGTNRMLFYWLAITLVRADGNALGDVIVRNSHLPAGLPLSATLTAIAMVVLLFLWPRDSGRMPRA